MPIFRKIFNYTWLLATLTYICSFFNYFALYMVQTQSSLYSGDVIYVGNNLLYQNKHQALTHVVLENGLTVLIYPMRNMPKISAQLWYHVGSKDEKTGEKGLAHFLEHMLFKGTGHLSESDINIFTHKLSGYSNAFTSYDTTMYLFDMPSQHWYEVLPVFADCMKNARLDQEHLNSELKAVIQELKMYRDDYSNFLFEELISAIFADHPYHYPIIGFKQDLWNLSRNALIQFYKTHYVPNNAVLVLVGDIDTQDALQRIQGSLGNIPGSSDYKKIVPFFTQDIVAKSITLYRAVENPTALCTWVIPGLKDRYEYIATKISWLIAQGKGSRLYRKLVDELQLVTDVQSFLHNFFEYGLFSIEFQPKNSEDIKTIQDIILKELDELSEYGWSDKENLRAEKKIQADYVSLFENPQKLGMAIGETFLATGDDTYVFSFLDQHYAENLNTDTRQFIKKFLRHCVMHTGLLLPITEEEQARLDVLQEQSDAIDAQVLATKIRQTPVEDVKYAKDIQAQLPTPYSFPRATTYSMDNGLAVMFYQSDMLPMIELVLELKTKHYYEPDEKQGLSLCTSQMILEGTRRYTGYELALELESYGMSLQVDPGCITLTVLKDDLERGLEFLQDILQNATLDATALDKIKEQMASDIDAYWDEPSEFSNQLMREELYAHHPYSKNILGSHETIGNITHADVVAWYQQSCVPEGATLVIVGDIQGYNIQQLVDKYLNSWQGVAAPVYPFPELLPVNPRTILYPIKRDQTVLCFAGRSVSRMDNDFDRLLIFDQIFSGGLLNSMNSRLFMLREESGLFYSIKGSLVACADEVPGIVFVKTLVSNDRLEEAIEKIQHTINTAIDTVTIEEFEQAKCIIANVLVENFSTNQHIATSLLFLKRYHLPADYFDTRIATFDAITMAEMKNAVKKYAHSDNLVCIKVGRLEQ